ncbi:MAG: hypothetical protein OXF01_03745 [Gemmatimonadetes bacterium]|nr:hypothetical protein [Gemmatimonadota bacterium]
MTTRVNLIGLLGAVAILATFAFPATDRASAQETFTYSLECDAASGVWYVAVTNSSPRGYSNIPCDEAKPGWTFDTRNTTLGDILFLYDNDPVPGTGLRAQEQGNKRPPVAAQPPLADGTTYTTYTYNADANNRAVRGDDGECYREQLVNRKWKRSRSYGSSDAACRNASWNAHYRSEGEPLINPDTGTFPQSWIALP